MVTIKKIHLAWALVIGIAGPAVAGVSAYYNSLSALAPKAQVDKMNDKLDRVAEDVAEMKGILKELRRGNPSNR